MRLSRKEQVISVVVIIFGNGFALYSMYLFTQSHEWYFFGGVFTGVFMAFNQADRNVYRKRVLGLHKAISDYSDEIVVEREEYTDYTIREKTE